MKGARGVGAGKFGLTVRGRPRNGTRRVLRALVAAGLAVLLAVTAVAPHAHTGDEPPDACAVCVVRGADAARSETPDVAPLAAVAELAPLAPGLAPVTGAPLGAVPGQSPPPRA